ncbi:hypothetical protein GCM10010112_67620 [Actinoplanes lobatus]|uniref:Uncharacterized protein n=1 Tax=Actinoplanes lobatus TaxID=113568 RepID=A0A7W7HER0_9ACTN|nr:hypothetical protein [Actinoplanes lobatus]MBB4749159.1 hypothetical protein [Actinoplanes lobatus]GGN86279.1 hypothetical protein GCM10010112_67620 [Actinoplanes lobatus]GIE42744.1 hypothetical protein Alo02nite_56420 [Actinoplanes lobatus]
MTDSIKTAEIYLEASGIPIGDTIAIRAWLERLGIPVPSGLLVLMHEINKAIIRAGDAGYQAGRLNAIAHIEQMPCNLGDEGWNTLADKAAEAGYDRRVVLRRRKPEDNFTALTIEAAYQHGYRLAAETLRGVAR